MGTHTRAHTHRRTHLPQRAGAPSRSRPGGREGGSAGRQLPLLIGQARRPHPSITGRLAEGPSSRAARLTPSGGGRERTWRLGFSDQAGSRILPPSGVGSPESLSYCPVGVARVSGGARGFQHRGPDTRRGCPGARRARSLGPAGKRCDDRSELGSHQQTAGGGVPRRGPGPPRRGARGFSACPGSWPARLKLVAVGHLIISAGGDGDFGRDGAGSFVDLISHSCVFPLTPNQP